MESREQLQQNEGWYSIVPTEEIPEGVNTWAVDVLDVGKLTVILEDKPGGGGYDNKAFVLSGDVPGLAINGAELHRQGFKILKVSLEPFGYRSQQDTEIRLRESSSCFRSTLYSTNGDKQLKPQYWFNANDNAEKPDMRDIMVRPERDQLEQIQIRFPEGGDD